MKTTSLDDLLRAQAHTGRLGHLTLAKTAGDRWQAAHKAPGASGYHIEIRATPDEALRAIFAPLVVERDGEDLI